MSLYLCCYFTVNIFLNLYLWKLVLFFFSFCFFYFLNFLTCFVYIQPVGSQDLLGTHDGQLTQFACLALQWGASCSFLPNTQGTHSHHPFMPGFNMFSKKTCRKALCFMGLDTARLFSRRQHPLFYNQWCKVVSYSHTSGNICHYWDV